MGSPVLGVDQASRIPREDLQLVARLVINGYQLPIHVTWWLGRPLWIFMVLLDHNGTGSLPFSAEESQTSTMIAFPFRILKPRTLSATGCKQRGEDPQQGTMASAPQFAKNLVLSTLILQPCHSTYEVPSAARCSAEQTDCIINRYVLQTSINQYL